MFGVVPGARYGWPKNILHWKGIQESIIDLCATVPVQFVIADGIVAMEGNGPLNGTARPLGKIVLADDPVAGMVEPHSSVGMGFDDSDRHLQQRVGRLWCAHRNSKSRATFRSAAGGLNRFSSDSGHRHPA
jgi:Domain of unknown function (DUF362)